MVPNGHDIIVSKHPSSGFLSLPPELKHGIVKLSPPNTLASLARTHPALQVVAERALYLSLHNPVLKCLETLATNSEKAGFVRFLTMDIYYYENNPDGFNWEQAMISYLLNALVNMHSLSDLRMRLSPIKSWSKSLDNILCNVHSSFRLQTLYCNADLDLSRIIKGQTELQILGIYNHYSNGARFLATLKQLQSTHLELHLPVIVALRVDFLDGFNQISVFPIFNSIDRYPSIDQVMAESFNKLELEERRPDTLTEISGLSIYLVDSSDIPSIHVLTKNMTTRFPGIIWLTFCFENPCEIPSQEIKKIISLFPCLKDLHFELWAGHDGHGDLPEDIKMAHKTAHKMTLVKDWELACPELDFVLFMDGSILERRGNTWYN